MTFQIGANNGDTLVFTASSARATSLEVTMSALTVTSQTISSGAITSLDSAINQVSSERAKYGAVQNRLESTIRSLAVASENTSAANSRIADADIAQSMSEMVRTQILQQAGISVLAQANQAPSLVLQLLK